MLLAYCSAALASAQSCVCGRVFVCTEALHVSQLSNDADRDLVHTGPELISGMEAGSDEADRKALHTGAHSTGEAEADELDTACAADADADAPDTRAVMERDGHRGEAAAAAADAADDDDDDAADAVGCIVWLPALCPPVRWSVSMVSVLLRVPVASVCAHFCLFGSALNRARSSRTSASAACDAHLSSADGSTRRISGAVLLSSAARAGPMSGEASADANSAGVTPRDSADTHACREGDSRRRRYTLRTANHTETAHQPGAAVYVRCASSVRMSVRV